MTPEDIIYLKFISPNTIIVLKILSAIISLFFIFCIGYFIRHTSWMTLSYSQSMKEFFAFKPQGEKKLEKTWKKITKRLQSPLESEHKLSLIEADKLLDEVLEKAGYKGESTGEMLKQITIDTLSNIQEVREAHRIRNNIVHDPDYRVTLEQAQRLIKIYEKAFQDLNVF